VPLHRAGVVYAAVAWLTTVHGVIYAEWCEPADFDKGFMWTWSAAGQVGLLMERNKLAAELTRANERIESRVAERTRELSTALARLLAVPAGCSQLSSVVCAIASRGAM
jgi:hypothetical protein